MVVSDPLTFTPTWEKNPILTSIFFQMDWRHMLKAFTNYELVDGCIQPNIPPCLRVCCFASRSCVCSHTSLTLRPAETRKACVMPSSALEKMCWIQLDSGWRCHGSGICPLPNFLGTPGEDYFKGNPKSLNFYFLVIWWGKGWWWWHGSIGYKFGIWMWTLACLGIFFGAATTP